MAILALETSSHWLSVAVGGEAANGVAGWVTREVEVGPGHSGRILPLVQEALAEAGTSLKQLAGIAFGAGPGSFTGVRIACGVAQGLALAIGLPVVPVCSLLAVAETARIRHGLERVCAVTDARMREVYAAAWRYRASVWDEVMAPVVMPPEEAAAWFRKLTEAAKNEGVWSFAGDGLIAYPELESSDPTIAGCGYPDIRPSALAVGTLALAAMARGEVVTAAAAAPLYVRQRVALTRAERESGGKL